MIDIHSHVLPFVDDGSPSLEVSLGMLATEKAAGVTDVFCTPHYRVGYFEPSREAILESFEALKGASEKLGVNLHLGREIATFGLSFAKVGTAGLFTLAESNYALLEFDYNNPVDVIEIVYELKLGGFIPVVAHVERYTYVSSEYAEKIVESGALLQINADSLFKTTPYYSKVKKLLKLDLVHFVASDFHSNRKFLLGDAYAIIKKKFGEERAERLFEGNARKILESLNITQPAH